MEYELSEEVRSSSLRDGRMCQFIHIVLEVGSFSEAMQKSGMFTLAGSLISHFPARYGMPC